MKKNECCQGTHFKLLRRVQEFVAHDLEPLPEHYTEEQLTAVHEQLALIRHFLRNHCLHKKD